MGDGTPAQTPKSGDIKLDAEFYRSLVEAMEEGVMVVDASERVVAVNRGACRILGVSEADLLGKCLGDSPRITCEDGSVLLKEDHPAIVSLRTDIALSHVVMEVSRPNGTTVWISGTTLPLRREGQKPHGVLCTFQDISANKTMERALRESESKLRTFIQETPVGILMTNENGRCGFVNRTWSEMSGLSFEECYGQGWMLAVHPDDRRAVTMAWRRLTDLGLPSEQEFRFQRSDQTIVWAHVRTVSMREDCGGLMGYLWVASDITEQKRAEEELNRIFNVSLDLLCVARLDGYFTRVNPSFTRVLGYSQDELLSRPIYDLLHPEDRMDMQEQLSKLASGFEEVRFECRARCRDGSWRWLSWHFPAPIDRLLYVVARDVTERKRTEDALIKAAHTDPLTGLQNRATLMSGLSAKVARAAQYDSRLAVLFIDLDGFKEVNDTHGHSAGDFVLKEVAARLRTCVRRSDTVARFGGDEYVIVVEDLNQANDVEPIATKILNLVGEPILLPSGQDVVVHASVGMASFPRDGGDPDTLIRYADKAMYEAKESGGHRYI